MQIMQTLKKSFVVPIKRADIRKKLCPKKRHVNLNQSDVSSPPLCWYRLTILTKRGIPPTLSTSDIRPFRHHTAPLHTPMIIYVYFLETIGLLTRVSGTIPDKRICICVRTNALLAIPLQSHNRTYRTP